MKRSFACLLVAALPLGCAEADGPEPIGVATQAITVGDAVSAGCSTTSVKGLSEQIVAEADCLAPGAFVAVPAQPNLTLGPAVFAYLEAPAKDALVSALTANKGTSMTVNSMLRTVAQQYLLYAWYKNGQCGVGLAATPGNSNHESGLALDVEEHDTWKPALTTAGFQWFGAADPVHFDFAGMGAVDERGKDVLAFQKLWNLNNPNDMIAEDGQYGPMTEGRLTQSPADGFPMVPSCGSTMQPDLFPAIEPVDAKDVFDDHASKGALDLFEGDEYAWNVSLENRGDAPGTSLTLAVEALSPALELVSYTIGGDTTTHMVGASSADIAIASLAPKSTVKIALKVAAKAYSVEKEPTSAVRAWVKDAGASYHQASFGVDPTIDVGQTFGKRLEVASPCDVYSRTRWEFDSTREEGWASVGGSMALSDPKDGSLLVASASDGSGVMSPPTAYSATKLDAIELRAKRTGGSGSARLLFATKDSPAISPDKAMPFELPDDGAFHVVRLEGASNPSFQGTITALRVDAAEGAGAVLLLDYVHAISSTTSSTSSSSSSSSGGGADPAPTKGGCSCESAGSGDGEHAPWLVLVGLAAIATRARRRPARS